MEAGGNDRAAETWLARWNKDSYPEPDGTDLSSVRDFIKLKYQDKAWYRDPGHGQPEVTQPSVAAAACAATAAAPPKAEAAAEVTMARVEPRATVSDLLSGDTPKGAGSGSALSMAVPVQSLDTAPGSPLDLGFGCAAAPGWSADFDSPGPFDSPGLTSTACDASTACDGSGSAWGGSSGGLSTGDDLLDLDTGIKLEAPTLGHVPPMPGAPVLLEATNVAALGAAGSEAITEKAPLSKAPVVTRERGASQPEPAEEPPPVLEATAVAMQRPMPCATVPTGNANEKDRFAALDDLLGAKPVLEFGDLLSMFHERNPIAGLEKQGPF